MKVLIIVGFALGFWAGYKVGSDSLFNDYGGDTSEILYED